MHKENIKHVKLKICYKVMFLEVNSIVSSVSSTSLMCE